MFRSFSHYCLRDCLRAGAASAVAVALVGLSHVPASAQDQQASEQDKPGSIIVLRDVPYGTALPRYAEGETLEVETGPDRILLDAISQGLQPLTSDEQATIFGSSQGSLGSVNQIIGDQLRHAEVAIGANLTRQHSQSAGGIVSSALAQLPSVGAIVRNAMGKGQ